MLTWFDSHAHWTDPQFDSDRDKLLKALPASGVVGVMNPGASMTDSAQVVSLINSYDFLYGAVGVSPHHAEQFAPEDLLQLKDWLSLPKVKAVGEVGIDYYYDYPRDRQWAVFKAQWQLALTLRKPIIIHLRDAYGDMEKFLSQETSYPAGVFHCFSGSTAFAKFVLDKGFYISLAGPVTYKNAHRPQEVARYVPLDRLLIETDAPYLPPHPFRGQRNQSAHVKLIAEKIAALRGILPETLAQKTAENAAKLFSISLSAPLGGQ